MPPLDQEKKTRLGIDTVIDNGNCTDNNNNSNKGCGDDDTTDDDDENNKISPALPSPPRKTNRKDIGSVFDKEEIHYISIDRAESLVDYCLTDGFHVNEINSFLNSLNLSKDDKIDLQSYMMQKEDGCLVATIDKAYSNLRWHRKRAKVTF